MIDYHVHTPLCRHAKGKMEEYIKEGAIRGLSEIGFADHFPLKLLNVFPKIPVTMNPDELEGYVYKVKELASSAPLEVKLGVELDYIPGKTEALAELLQKYPFDYIIGSVHYIGDWDCTHPFYQKEYLHRSLESIYSDYFSLIEKACQCGLFDIIAHVDVIKKFGHRLADEKARPLFENLAKVFRQTSTCLELNTSGWDTSADELYPAPVFLDYFVQEDVPFTLGSDAHAPDQVARHFHRLLQILSKEGIIHAISFKNRKKSYIALKKT